MKFVATNFKLPTNFIWKFKVGDLYNSKAPLCKGSSAAGGEGLFYINPRILQSLRLGKLGTANCQASATPKNASKGERHPKHFLGLRLIDKTIFCKVSLSKE